MSQKITSLKSKSAPGRIDSRFIHDTTKHEMRFEVRLRADWLNRGRQGIRL